MEEALFSGYLAQVRRLHPDAPLPAVHQSDEILDNAEQLRVDMGTNASSPGSTGATPAAPTPGRGC